MNIMTPTELKEFHTDYHKNAVDELVLKCIGAMKWTNTPEKVKVTGTGRPPEFIMRSVKDIFAEKGWDAKLIVDNDQTKHNLNVAAPYIELTPISPTP